MKSLTRRTSAILVFCIVCMLALPVTAMATQYGLGMNTGWDPNPPVFEKSVKLNTYASFAWYYTTNKGYQYGSGRGIARADKAGYDAYYVNTLRSEYQSQRNSDVYMRNTWILSPTVTSGDINVASKVYSPYGQTAQSTAPYYGRAKTRGKIIVDGGGAVHWSSWRYTPAVANYPMDLVLGSSQ